MVHLSFTKNNLASLKHSVGISAKVKLGIALVFALMVMLSPTVMSVSPGSVVSAATPADLSGHWASPSTKGQDGNDFSTQAAIGALTARPTNNIVNTNSFYDVVFLTATSGAIKTIQVTFPAGTTIPSTAFFNEAEGIGAGTVSKSGQTLTYTVTNAVNVPAGTKIRLEFANINNPLNPNANYKVTVTTRNAANAIIDGPTQSTAYTIKQIGVNAIANNAITNPKISDGAVTGSKISDGAVTNSKLGFESVTNAKLATPSVASAELFDLSVTNSKLSTGSVTSDKVATGTFGLPAAQRLGPVVNLPFNSPQISDASCLSGEQVIGGGFDFQGTGNANDARILDAFIVGNSWRVLANNAGGTDLAIQALAVCALDFPL
jgi:hypothetical protein